MRCRICRTARNLKFTPQQLRLQTKNGNKNKLRLPLSAIPQTTGNICIDCDERLQNFHQLEDGGDVVDVEIPIIVDDDERLYDIFYNKTTLQCNETQATMQPLQCHSLGSDGDAEVIEVLTSRESTPEITGFTENAIPSTVAMPTNPTIIDVIDLENYEETDQECYNETPIPAENKTRLLGCLNLVTSDSESEINFEPCPREEIQLKNMKSPKKSQSPQNLNSNSIDGSFECTNNNNINFKNSSVTIQHNLPVCGVCGISFLDKQSLNVHVLEHEEFKCPVCNAHFHIPLDLVNHMRKKHRTYDGNDLCEGARCSQDSAMTIRLRFMQRFTFYECQLCGVIESQFKAHKTHIMQKHADESKSLKDPMMKTQLKCPSCHQNCGTAEVDVCRHLLSKHESAESDKYLKEVTDSKTLAPHVKYLHRQLDGVRFITLGSQKHLFFQCLLCIKGFGSQATLLKHLNGHNIDEWKDYRARKSKPISSFSEIEPKRHLKRKARSYSGQTDVVPKKEEQPPVKKIKLELENPVKNADKSKKVPLPKDSKSKAGEIAVKKLPANNTKTNFLPPPEVKRQKKLKHKVEKKSQNKRTQSKSLTKVKVKPPLRHFPTQTYCCKYCLLPLKGFRKLQMHLLSSHRLEEYHSCERCPRAFATKATLELHCAQNICRRKRKCTSISLASNEPKDRDNNNLDENFNKDERKHRKSTSKQLPNMKSHQKEKSPTSSEPNWLKELLQLSREKKLKNMTYSNTAIKNDFDENFLGSSDHEELNTVVQIICRFCSEFFTSEDDFSMHEKKHIALKDMPCIYFSQSKLKSNST